MPAKGSTAEMTISDGKVTDFPGNSSDLGHDIFTPRTENNTFDFANQVGTLLFYPYLPLDAKKAEVVARM
eukprot:7287498-Prymnesium_polylepis.1